ncbi:MAG TPA: amidohydrolase family protein [Gemmatimonadaceae bacterium]|nr:amidohydrolase family protein [Gemmatimonadaceae bacterium]
MLTLIENGEVYAPEPLGRRSVLLVDGKVGRVGEVDRRALDALGLEHRVIDADGCVVTPGFIDPHEHLLGGSGESGLSTQTPMIFLSEIVPFGITTVVGVLGVDTTMKTMAGLLARVKGLEEEGISACMWTGGYNVPPTTVMESIREDMLFIDEVIGAGEVAIADKRGLCPSPQELAKLVLDTHVGGLLTGKAGVTHFHVGEHPQRLKRLRELVEGDWAVTADMLYPTHVERSPELFDEAMALAAQGATIDVDVIEGDLAKWARRYLEKGGDPNRLTASSDAGSSHPGKLYEQLCNAVVEHRLPLDTTLRFVTENPSRVLKLRGKGRLEPGNDGDVVVMRRGSLDIVHVIARGQHMVDDGQLVVRERFLPTSTRRFALRGTKDEQSDEQQ